MFQNISNVPVKQSFLMYDMLKAKIDRLAGKIILKNKKPFKMTQNYRKHSGYPLWVFLCQFYANSMSILCLYKICVFLTWAWPPPFWTMLKNCKIGVHCTQRHPWEGGGRQTVNTRSTFGEALKYFGYNGTNELCGRSMTSKLSVHEPNGLFHCYKDIDQKVHFYGQTLSNWDFCLGESHEILANIGFKYVDLRSVRDFFFRTIHARSQERVA